MAKRKPSPQPSLFEEPEPVVAPAPDTFALVHPDVVRFARARAESRALNGPALVRLACWKKDYEEIAVGWAEDAGRLGNEALDLEEGA